MISHLSNLILPKNSKFALTLLRGEPQVKLLLNCLVEEIVDWKREEAASSDNQSGLYSKEDNSDNNLKMKNWPPEDLNPDKKQELQPENKQEAKPDSKRELKSEKLVKGKRTVFQILQCCNTKFKRRNKEEESKPSSNKGPSEEPHVEPREESREEPGEDFSSSV